MKILTNNPDEMLLTSDCNLTLISVDDISSTRYVVSLALLITLLTIPINET